MDPTSSRITVNNHHLEIQVLQLRHLWHFFQQGLKSLLCSVGNVVDHICAQLTNTELLTCHNRRSVEKYLDDVSDTVDVLYNFTQAHVPHRSLELCGWVKTWRGRSRPYRIVSPCQRARSWLLRYGRFLPTSWPPPWRPHHWYHHHPWMT